MNNKKILLFVVEGLSDEAALAPALEQIVVSQHVKFKVMHSDITSDFASSVTNIEGRIRTMALNKFLKDNKQFELNDINGIVHIVDTDGAFVPDEAVTVSNISKASYHDNHIECKNRESFIRSKNNKEKNMKYLSQINQITASKRKSIPYSVYYMSCNLDHVLHGNRNYTDMEKKNNSIAFADKYDDPDKFIEFFMQETVKIPGTYSETWEYAQIELNSLKRGSNFWLCIDKYNTRND